MALTRRQIYKILQRELPEDTYPDGAATSFYHTADMDTTAEMLARFYANGERVRANIFPQSADELIIDHELMHFQAALDASFSLEDRRNRILQKIRSPRGISIPRLEGVVRSVLGESVDMEIINLGCSEGSWRLDESQLDISTILNGRRGDDIIPRPADPNCEFGASPPPGYTEQEWREAREEAYTYEVRIYNRTLTVDERARLDQELTRAEPARSAHIITDNLTDAEKIEGDT